MSNTKLSGGVVHKLPPDLESAISAVVESEEAWEDITPLARNEWICWVEEAKRPETRANRVDRVWQELIQGKRRPCCWAGCIHRMDKPAKVYTKKSA